MNRNERNTTIELLRVICMFLLVASHCVSHGGVASMEPCINKYISLAFASGAKILFIVFVAISAWFLVDTKFKAKRFLKIWLQILFYNVVFFALAFFLKDENVKRLTWNRFIGAFFPIIGNSHGFAAAYTAFYLTIPFLQVIQARLTKQSATILVGMLLVTQSLSQFFGEFIRYQQPLRSEILLFVMAYFIAFYLKKWPLKIQNNKPILALLVVSIWAICGYGWCMYAQDPSQRIPSYIISVIGNEHSIFNIVAGFSLFLLVKDIKMPRVSIINTIASTTFGILLYHDHNYFRPVVWKRFLNTESWYYVSPGRFIFNLCMSTLLVFCVGVIIDLARQFLLEKPIVKSKAFNTVCEKIDGLFILSNGQDH